VSNRSAKNILLRVFIFLGTHTPMRLFPKFLGKGNKKLSHGFTRINTDRPGSKFV